ALIVAFGVKEIRTEEQKEAANVVYSRREVLKQIFTLRVLFTVMVITALIQIANFSVQPWLALYVGDMTQSDNIAFLSGWAVSATGFGNLV
ncbi:MFS transporter, partial [Listeria monocytogenes]|nr:MFS transporter [Listeria monocytogenes]